MTYAVAFDLDGTLVDTPRAIVETFTAAFASLGVEARDAAAIRDTIGRPLDRAFADLLAVAVDDRLVTRCVAEYQMLFRKLILPRAAELVFPGVADGLSTLSDQGFALAVATSKVYASAHALLEAAGLREHFSVVVGADQVTQPKPHPEMGRVVMHRLDIPPKRTVMVGDTTHDLLMARDAGMRSVAVTYGVHSLRELESMDPTWIADSFDDVLTCVQDGCRSIEGCRS